MIKKWQRKDKVVMKHLLFGLLVGPLLLMGLIGCREFSSIKFSQKTTLEAQNTVVSEEK